MPTNKVVLNDEVLIDLSEDTVVEKAVAPGYTFHKSDGTLAVGTHSCRGIPPKDVNFYDYDGTLVYAYTLEQAQALTELPELPEHEGLIAQEWNYTLDEIKSYDRPVDVGANYITDDGKTRFYITIPDGIVADFALVFRQTVSKGVTVDWGDGQTETFEGTGYVKPTHTYQTAGNYVISLAPAAGSNLVLESGGYGSVTSETVFGTKAIYKTMVVKAEIGEKVTLGSGALSYTGIETISLPIDLKIVGELAIRGCYKLKSVVIPKNITSLEASVCRECYALKKVILPHGFTKIPNYAIYQGGSLEKIVLPDTITEVGSYAFADCHSLTEIIIPKLVTTVGIYAFQHARALKRVVFKNDNTSLKGDYLFDNCYMLNSVNIPQNVTTINSHMLSYCRSLAYLAIPPSVTSIGNYGLAYCEFKVLDFSQHTSVPTINTNSMYVNNLKLAGTEIRVPAALYDEWIAATNWATYADYIVAV